METEEDVKKFPPLVVYFDGCRYWLADGHHRYWAIRRRGFKKVLVKVIDGTHDEAVLAAVKLNSKNGLRFNDGDWEKIIPLVTGKEQWSNWTNRRLAEELGCSEITIRRYRPEDSVATGVATEKRQGKDGKMYRVRKSKSAISKKTTPVPKTVDEKKPTPPSPVPANSPPVPAETTTSKPETTQLTERQQVICNLFPTSSIRENEVAKDIAAVFPNWFLRLLVVELFDEYLRKENWQKDAEGILLNFIRNQFFRSNDEMRNDILRKILHEIIDDHDSIDKVFEVIAQEKKRLELEYGTD